MCSFCDLDFSSRAGADFFFHAACANIPLGRLGRLFIQSLYSELAHLLEILKADSLKVRCLLFLFQAKVIQGRWEIETMVFVL